jgi:hypothetical protein
MLCRRNVGIVPEIFYFCFGFMRKYIIILLVLFATPGLKAQLEVGFFGGTSFYMGDLNPNIPFLQPDFAYGVLARYNFSSRWAAKMNLYQGVIHGDDEVSNFQSERALTFRSGITELGGTMEFHFLPYFNGSMRSYWTPYLFAGAAMVYHRPQRNETDLRDYGTEGQYNTQFLLPPDTERPEYSYYSFSIPFGIGLKYSFSKRISASLEWGMRKTFTDYLDDVSTTYYTSAALVSQGTQEYEDLLYSDPNLSHEPNMQRGNSQTNDWYSFAGLTITYFIDLRNRNKCSDFEESY